MKFAIKGADAVTGDDQHITVDAPDQAAALAMAKNQGIFVSRIEALPEETVPLTPPRVATPEHRVPVEKPADHIEQSTLAAVIWFIAFLNFIGAILGGMVVGSDSAAAGWIVFSSGCLGGLLLLALARVLDYLAEAVHWLRKILRVLESKR